IERASAGYVDGPLRGSKRSAALLSRASSSSESSRPAAPTFDSSCATLLAPGIATTLGCRITHAKATWAGVASCSFATWRSASSVATGARGGETPGARGMVRGKEEPSPPPHPASRRVCTVVAAREQPLREGAVRHDETSRALGVRDKLALGFALDE